MKNPLKQYEYPIYVVDMDTVPPRVPSKVDIVDMNYHNKNCDMYVRDKLKTHPSMSINELLLEYYEYFIEMDFKEYQ